MKLQFLNLKQRYNLKDYKFTLILLVLAVSVIGVFMGGECKCRVSAQTDHGRGIRSACHGCDLTDRLQVDPEFLLADVCGKYCLTSGCYFSWDRGKWCDKMAGSWICAVSAFRSDKIDHDLVFCQIFG